MAAALPTAWQQGPVLARIHDRKMCAIEGEASWQHQGVRGRLRQQCGRKIGLAKCPRRVLPRLICEELIPEEHPMILRVGYSDAPAIAPHALRPAHRAYSHERSDVLLAGEEIRLAEHDVGSRPIRIGYAVPDEDARVVGVGDEQFPVRRDVDGTG